MAKAKRKGTKVTKAERKPMGGPKGVEPKRKEPTETLPVFRETAKLFLRGTGGEGVKLTADQEERAERDMAPIQAAFLRHYAMTGTAAGAAQALQDEDGRPLVSVHTHGTWIERFPAYKRLYLELKEGVDLAWEMRLHKAADEGLSDVQYDGQGKEIGRRVREDGSLLRMVAAAKLPEYREDRGGGANIQIIIERTSE